MNRRLSLTGSTAVSSGLLDADGNPIQVRTVDVRNLPEIDRDALPGLPIDMEARLMSGDEPVIILHHPGSDLHIEVPLLDRTNLAKYAAAIYAARVRQAMGEAPEGDGYRVRDAG
jgi:hypothetical protein